MRQLGTIDLEVMDLAMKSGGTFNENNLENSNLKRLGVGKILDTLGNLKDKKFIILNSDGSFSITEIGRNILWNKSIPLWARVMRLLQIKSCSMEQIQSILNESYLHIDTEIEKLRQNQFVMMSPQRIDEKVVKIFEILPEGISEIDKTDKEGFEKSIFGKTKPEIEILSSLDEILKEIQDSQIEPNSKEKIIQKIKKLKDRLEI
jgi:hypothetical protein